MGKTKKTKKTEVKTGTVENPTAGRALALVTQNRDGSVTIGNRKLTLAKRVTLPTLKHAAGTAVYFRVESPMAKGQPMKAADGTTRAAAWVMEVTNLATNVRCRYVLSAILRRSLNDEYDGKTDDNPKGKNLYVGKSFAAHKSLEEIQSGSDATRKYRQIELVELNDDGEAADDAA